MNKKKILIVEDEYVSSMHLKIILEGKGGYDINICSSGEEAIERINDYSPDLIIMDIILDGDIDGIETARQILNKHDIPIVFLTASSDDGTYQRASDVKMAGYIKKPFNKNELLYIIESAFK